MKFNFKKIASVLASAVMIGSTVGIAAAANYPAPFIAGGSADVAVVVGSSAATSDFLAAADLGSNLQAELAKQTATTGASSSASVSGGDSVNLASSSQKLFYGSAMNAAKTSITSAEMSTLLKDGTFSDDGGTSYTYTQSIALGNRTVKYDTSSSDLTDPELIVDAGTDSTLPLYTYKLTLNKNLNVTHSDVQGNDIEIFGKKFTIGANSNSAAATPILYLYGTGATVTLNEGEEATVTLGDKEYVVKATAITQSGTTDKVSVTIDGGTVREISENSASTISGITVYAKTVTYSAKESTQNSATISLGGEVLKLQHNSVVYKGTDETSIQNTKVTLTTSPAVGGSLSAIQIATAMQSSTSDYLKTGGTFVDPVFGGMKVSFAGATPAIDSTTREKFSVDTDNSRNVRVTFTTDLTGTEKQFTFLHDQDTSESTVTPILADTSNKTIHIIEGEAISINEYAVINSGDYGRIIKLTSIPTGSLDSNSKIYFDDAVTGTQVFDSGLSVGITGNGTTNINGQPYYFKVANGTSSSTVSITWGASSDYGVAGTVTTISPRIKLKNGEWFAIMAPITNITRGVKYSLPGADTLATYEGGDTITWNISSGPALRYTQKIGNVNYTFSSVTDAPVNLTRTLDGISTDGATVDCNFSSTFGGAILFLEEKKTTETSNSDNGDVICIAGDSSGSTTPVEISVATPKVSGTWSALQTWTSDSYQQAGVTRYGTFVKYNSVDNDKVEIFYPTDQMFADVLFVSESATVTAGTAGSGSVTELGSVTVKDTEVSLVQSKSLIVVGGSCINSVAANILGGALCDGAFTTATGIGADQALIKVVKNPYLAADTVKVAMLVAGYEAADTTKAVKYLMTSKPSTAVGEVKLSTSGTVATVATTTV